MEKVGFVQKVVVDFLADRNFLVSDQIDYPAGMNHHYFVLHFLDSDPENHHPVDPDPQNHPVGPDPRNYLAVILTSNYLLLILLLGIILAFWL